jgi:uncharacterized membrane protein YjfL (UPF0719 family)
VAIPDFPWTDAFFSLIWSVIAVVIAAIAFPLAIFLFDKLTPIDEWAEIRKRNMAVALYISALLLSFAIVISAVFLS